MGQLMGAWVTLDFNNICLQVMPSNPEVSHCHRVPCYSCDRLTVPCIDEILALWHHSIVWWLIKTQLINDVKSVDVDMLSMLFPQKQLAVAIVVTGEKGCLSGMRAGRQAGVTLWFLDHWAKILIHKFINFGSYLGLMFYFSHCK